MSQLINIQEYKRIFETIYSVLSYVGLEPQSNCVYFSLIGAVLLHEHYDIECKSYSGAAAYHVNSDINAVLAFAEKTGDNSYFGSKNGFHSWNENKDFVVDFTAPLFPEMSMQKYGKKICQRKMFQRKIGDKCQSPMEFKKEGDFFHLPNLELGRELIDMFADNPMNMDIVTICNNWFYNPISNMPYFCEVKDGNGKKDKIILSEIEFNEAW